MKAKHWLLAGVGCIAVSILAGAALGLYWMGQVRSFASGGDSPRATDPFQGFGVVMVVGALTNLLFFVGIVVLIIGFIKLAKEPSAGAKKTPASQEPSGSD
jgi:hypothetical protein